MAVMETLTCEALELLYIDDLVLVAEKMVELNLKEKVLRWKD